MRLPKAGFSATAGVCVWVCVRERGERERVCLNVHRCTLSVCTLSYARVAAQKPYMCIHPCVHAQQRHSEGEEE